MLLYQRLILFNLCCFSVWYFLIFLSPEKIKSDSQLTPQFWNWFSALKFLSQFAIKNNFHWPLKSEGLGMNPALFGLHMRMLQPGEWWCRLELRSPGFSFLPTDINLAALFFPPWVMGSLLGHSLLLDGQKLSNNRESSPLFFDVTQVHSVASSVVWGLVVRVWGRKPTFPEKANNNKTSTLLLMKWKKFEK